jgi:hypothetical protein
MDEQRFYFKAEYWNLRKGHKYSTYYAFRNVTVAHTLEGLSNGECAKMPDVYLIPASRQTRSVLFCPTCEYTFSGIILKNPENNKYQIRRCKDFNMFVRSESNV